MSTTKYPNRDALREAHDIYLDIMSQFVSKCLNEDIEEDIEISRIAYYVRTYWDNLFESEFDRYYEARSATQLIVEGRNRASHPPWDLDLEFTRTQLFLIAELLGKIGRLNAQREVEVIRDKLFSDDTAERLAESEQRLVAVELEKNEYEKDNAALSKQVDEKEKQRKKLDRNLKNAKERHNKLKSDMAGVEKRLKESEAAQADYKKRLETTDGRLKETESKLATVSNQLAAVQVEKSVSEECLAAVQKLLTTASIGDQLVFPPLQTDAAVRMLDRRGTDKQNYLLNLLEQKQPAIIYVQSVDMINKLLTSILPEKVGVIGKHNEGTSKVEATEMLEKLENRKLIAVVSNAAFSTLSPAHCVEHFVFCHLTPSLDEFFKRCQPAFTSRKNTYLHFIYNVQQDIGHLDEWLAQKYPDRETLNNFRRALEGCVGVNGDFINLKNLYSQLDLASLGITERGIETGLAIFEEVGALERNEDGIKLLPFSKRKSKIYRKGEELKEKTADFRAFQLEHSIEQIWTETVKTIDVDIQQIQ